MPVISMFFGIVVRMFPNDHGFPHFHAKYGGAEAVYQIDPPMLVAGAMSPRVQGMLTEWAALHRDELLQNWELCRLKLPAQRIAPLE